MSAKILLTGGQGFVAGSIITQVPGDCELHVISRSKCPSETPPNIFWHVLDWRDGGKLSQKLKTIAPEAVIHPAAIAGIDYCEEHQSEAHQVNVEFTAKLARISAQLGAKFVFVSTDNVFDGDHAPYDEESTTHPINYYGRIKVEAEVAALEAHDNCVIARLALVMGLPMLGSGNSFLARMIPTLGAREELGVPTNEIRTPIDVVTAARALIELATNDTIGCFHLSGNDSLNRHRMVQRIARSLGLNSDLVVPNDPTRIPGRAARPTDLSFNNAKARRLLHTPMLGLEAGLRLTMDEALRLKREP